MNKQSLRSLVCLSVILGCATSAAAAGRAPLTLQFSGGSLTAEGITPGGSAVVFAASIEKLQSQPDLYGPRHRAEVVADDDRDGTVRIELPAGTTMGIWAVVDVNSGRYAVSPTPGYEPQRFELPSGEALRHDNAGQLRKLQWPVSEMDVLLVRPGDGAWQLYASKDSGRDESRNTPGALRIDVGSMTPLGSTAAAPSRFRPGDIVVVFNSTRMQYGAFEVGQ
jgi:hypothetical protein